MNKNNVFMYWVGKDYKLIKLLRYIIYAHSYNTYNKSYNYNVHIINHENINNYITSELPKCFYDLKPAHQADYVRVNVLYNHSGIWLDSDIIVMDSLYELFNLINKNNSNGFFIRENNNPIFNGVFGSKSGTKLMLRWKREIDRVLSEKGANIDWTNIGSDILNNIYAQNPEYYSNYTIYNGLDNMYPVNWCDCVREYIDAPYNNYKNLIREFQPLIVLVNSVYKKIEEKNVDYNDIENIENNPLKYFIIKSINNYYDINKYNKAHINNFFSYIERDIIFNNIYSTQLWNDKNSNIPLSGPGSSIEKTAEISNLLDYFILNKNIKSVLDLGCGDLTWISRTIFFNNSLIKYIGIDIVKSVIDTNSKKYPNKEFELRDIVLWEIPEKYDLIIIRDVIFHMKNNEIKQLLNNIKNKFKYVAITSCKNDINEDNFDRWYYNRKNINIEPFNIDSDRFLHKLYEKDYDRYFYIYEDFL